MRNLLAFTAFLAAGFLLGSRRARKHGPVTVIDMAIEVDTSQATTALKELEARAVKACTAVEALSAATAAADESWLDEREGKPSEGEEVYVSVVRRAIRTAGKWELKSLEPIDLETDTVHWMKIPA
jgi:hypothetical protein